ncbi:type II CAAX endopeptidase family protein [Rhodanobacter sp. L36]|uniref:CPBP family intramembrane glutamic endopeptidase n=1 Tax=Rhodanobacter sp. L36 TaxID=1747221 RepID=UPI00131B7B28|nr:type II CAAX endopeptidase family protein [Rhodanobacter sp. L36]
MQNQPVAGASVAFTTPQDVPGWKRWLVYSPLARIVIFAALIFGFVFIIRTVMVSIGWLAKTAPPLHNALATLSMQLLPALIAYVVLVKLIERRRMSELSLRSVPTFGAGGLLLGIVLFSSAVGILWLVGSYHVTGTDPSVDWLPEVLVAGLGAGIGEEIMFRGGLFRIVEEGLGTWWALAISALFFGAAHAFNPGATLWSSAAIAIEAGILFGLLYHLTRSLWACVGLHAAWNTMQGTFYGIPVSGMKAHGWLVSYRTGPDWLSGGSFGAEASVVALLLCSVVSVVLATIALRRGSIVPMRRSR